MGASRIMSQPIIATLPTSDTARASLTIGIAKTLAAPRTLIAAMMPLSTAMVETGAAKMLAERLVYMVGDAGPMALLAGLFVRSRGFLHRLDGRFR